MYLSDLSSSHKWSRFRATSQLTSQLFLSMLYLMVEEKVYYIVKMAGSQSVKGYQPLISKSCSILKITHSSPPYRLIGHNQVFLIDRNVTVKLSSIKTIHVKLQHNVGFLNFKDTLKYMLVNVYMNKMNVRKWLYTGGFFHAFNFFVVSKGILHV